LQKASYLAIDLMRKKEMKLRRHSIDAPINGQDDEASLASNLESNEPTPLENLLNKEEVMLFEQALAQLQEDYRAAITIFYFVGLSIQECADFFGMNSSEAFKSRKSRAVKNLRDIINTLSQRQKIGADC
jgi:RNA polymerase sigma factor (sigma-70 family)